MFSKSSLRVAVAVVACAFTLSLASHAEVRAGSKSARVLITQKIDETKLVTREGNIHPLARSTKYDRGEAADSLPMPGIELLMKRSPEQEAAFTKLMDQLHSPGSPNFHQWLTNKEIGESFGVSQHDLEVTQEWLGSHGFKVTEVDPNGMWIRFNGTAAEVREAFHTQIHNFQVNGEQRYGNVTEPRIPAALADAVVGPVSLHNFRIHPPIVMRSPVQVSKEQGIEHVTKPTGATPDYTVSSTSYPFVPGDARTIYNVNPLISAGYTGAGTSIGLLEDSNDYTDADYANFVAAFFPSGLDGANASNLSTVHPGGCSNPGDTGNGTDFEVELDVEYATAMAPAAKVIIESCADSSTYGMVTALQNLGASGGAIPPVLSMSYGIGETGSGAAFNAAYATAFETLAAKGVSSFVSTGDQGTTTDDRSPDYGLHGNMPSGWSDSPYVTAVGGTDFYDGAKGTYTDYWNASNNSDYSSAKGYIPEIPWNDTCASSIVLNVVGFTTAYGAAGTTTGFCNTTTASSDGLQTDTGGSGGASNCYSGSPASNGTAGSGSCAGLAKPSYQTVFGNPADGVRDQPDVSLFASNGFWGHYLIICYSNASQGGTACTGAPSGWSGVGGTSASTPMMAGIQALIDQYTGATTNGVGQLQGAANYAYYALARNEYGASGNSTCNSNNIGLTGSTCVFNDVTSGDIEVACQKLSGTAYGCYVPASTWGASSTSTASYASAYSSTVGWDFATGIGTVNAFNMAANWASVAFTPVPTITGTVAGYTYGATQTAKTLTGAVSGPGSFPTGSVLFSYGLSANPVSGYTSIGTDALVAQTGCTNGGACVESTTQSFTPSAILTPGTYNIDVTYSTVNEDYKSGIVSATPVNFTVSKATPTVAVSNITSGYENIATLSASDTGVAGGAAPTGTVTFTVNGVTVTGTPICTPSGVVETCTETYLLPSNLTDGTYTIGASFAADTNYNTASNTGTLTVHMENTTTTVAANPASIASTATTQLTATVTCSGVGASVVGLRHGTVAVSCGEPSGTVTFTDTTNSAVLGSCTLTVNTLNSTCSAIANGSAMATGSNTISASYAAVAGKFNASSGTTTVTVTATTDNTGTGLTALPSTITSAQSSTLTATVTDTTNPGTVPTGTVTFTDTTNSANLGSCTLSSGQCSVVAAGTAVAFGSNTIGASYSPGSGFNSSSGTATLTRSADSTTTLLTANPSSIFYSSSTMLTATVADSTSSGTKPTGTVTFTDITNSASLGSCALVSGTCSITANGASLGSGTNTIVANYPGVTGTYTSSSGSTGVTVNPDGTSTAVTANPNSIASNASSQVTAIVTDTTSSGTKPTGMVTFTDITNSTSLGSCTLSAGTCSVTASGSALAFGANTIVANYAGVTGTFGSSNNSTTLTRNADSTSTGVSANPTSILTTASTSLTATVTDTTNSGAKPAGSVTFTDITNSANLGSCTLSAGTCSVMAAGSAMALGSNTIVASYAGIPGSYGASSGTTSVSVSSATVGGITFSAVGHNFGSEQVGTAATSFGVTVTNTSSTTAYPFSLVFTPANGFTSSNNCGRSIAAGAHCQLAFYFTPTAAGTVTATWSLTSQSGFTYSPSNGGTLTGTGVAAGAVKLTTAGHNFGTVMDGTTSPTYGTVLTNSTSTAQTLTLGTLSGTEFTVATNCTTTLAAGASCNLNFTFKPTTPGITQKVYTLSSSPTAVTSGGAPLPNGGITLTGTGQ